MEMSLLELIALAGQDREAAIQTASKLVVPWDVKFHSLLRRDYERLVPIGPIEPVPPLYFIFDRTAGFFIHNGGVRLQHDFYWPKYLLGSRHMQRLDDGPVLFNQPSDGITSVVLGKKPSIQVIQELGIKDEYLLTAEQAERTMCEAYIYAESGNHMAVCIGVNGGVPISEERPIIIGSSIGSSHGMKILVPKYAFTLWKSY